MVDIQNLPPQEGEPQLTARVAVKTLGEHFVAFLNANNLGGYLTEPDRVLSDDRVGDLLILTACCKMINLAEFKRRATRLREISHRAIRPCEAHTLLAKAMGYRNYNNLLAARECDDIIYPVWDDLGSMQQAAFGNTSVEDEKPPLTTKEEALLKKNAAFNKQRAEDANKQKAALKQTRRVINRTKRINRRADQMGEQKPLITHEDKRHDE